MGIFDDQPATHLRARVVSDNENAPLPTKAAPARRVHSLFLQPELESIFNSESQSSSDNPCWPPKHLKSSITLHIKKARTLRHFSDGCCPFSKFSSPPQVPTRRFSAKQASQHLPRAIRGKAKTPKSALIRLAKHGLTLDGSTDETKATKRCWSESPGNPESREAPAGCL